LKLCVKKKVETKKEKVENCGLGPGKKEVEGERGIKKGQSSKKTGCKKKKASD